MVPHENYLNHSPEALITNVTESRAHQVVSGNIENAYPTKDMTKFNTIYIITSEAPLPIYTGH